MLTSLVRRVGELGWPLARVVVRDDSMRPGLRPGDRLLVWRWRRWPLARPRPGDVVVVADPELAGLLLVKRVAARRPDGGYVVLGDNAAASRDSRSFGWLAPELIVGRVVWRYLPGRRRGPVR